MWKNIDKKGDIGDVWKTFSKNWACKGYVCDQKVCKIASTAKFRFN